MRKIEKMSETEKEVMKAVWELEPPVTVAEVLATTDAGRDWSYTTVATFLQRLVQKGMLRTVKKGNTNLYDPEMSAEEFRSFEAEAFIDEVYDGSVKGFLAALCRKETKLSITADDLDELKKMINDMD